MALRAHQITVQYPGSNSPALEEVSLSLEPGTCIALTGPNGGGKTTLLRVLTGLIPRVIRASVTGSVSVEGVDPWREDASRLVQLLQQDPKAQIIGPTVLLEAAMGPLFQGASREEALRRAYAALEMVEARGLAGRSTANLSGGEMARAALAGVLSTGTRYLLLDEPAASLDSPGREALARALDILRRSHGVIIATHDTELASQCDMAYTVRRRLERGLYRPQAPAPPRPPEPRGEPALVVEGLSVSYPGRGMVLGGAGFRARRGEIVALTGPNGSGKTSLLLAIAGLVQPVRGRVWTCCRPALLPQDPLLVFSRPTLREETGGPVPEWAESVADTPVLELSGGNLRIAALALVATRGGGVLLLDEPTSGLDPANRARITRIIAGLAAEGRAIVVATHDPVVARIAHKTVRLSGGRAWESSSAY